MPEPLGVVVLGSTGSIGTQTLDVIAAMRSRFKVVGLAAKSNAPLLAEQAARFGNPKTALADSDGISALSDLATLPEAEIVVVSVAGVIGLVPTLAAINAGKRVALASKEVLVAAGELVMPLVREKGAQLLPIDSEHSAIFQCLEGYSRDQVEGLIITASGGPFRGMSRSQLEDITPEQALNHPTWRMGGKITIDSANLMNKALETIEARWLFDMPMDRIEAVIHPQSIVHSFVRFTDGSVLGQCGWPNMRLPILYALAYPDRVPNEMKPWSPVETPNLSFEPVDHETFPALDMAKVAVGAGGTMPCAFNAANEEAANAFLRGDVKFLQITEIVAEVMERHTVKTVTLDNLLQTDSEARAQARDLMSSASAR